MKGALARNFVSFGREKIRPKFFFSPSIQEIKWIGLKNNLSASA